jgi:hypothetical protein
MLIPGESKNTNKHKIETDTMDYDGAGNFGRIPNKNSKKK